MSAHPMPEPTPISEAEREAKRRAIAEARLSVERDGVIDHDRMMAWLESWGTENELPPPAPRPWK